MRPQVLNVALKRVGQQAELLDIRDAFLPQRLRADVDWEVFLVCVHILVEKAALPPDSDCKTDDEV